MHCDILLVSLIVLTSRGVGIANLNCIMLYPRCFVMSILFVKPEVKRAGVTSVGVDGIALSSDWIQQSYTGVGDPIIYNPND